MPTCSVSFPGSASFTMQANTDYAGAGAVTKQLLGERVLSYGVTAGEHIVDWAADVVTVPSGAPGSLTVDLRALVTPDGSTLTEVTGKLVYLELVQLTGAADGALRRSAANPIAILSGTTDTLELDSGHVVLVDVLKSTATKVNDGFTFGASNKNIDLESTAGGQWAIIAAVI